LTADLDCCVFTSISCNFVPRDILTTPMSLDLKLFLFRKVIN